MIDKDPARHFLEKTKLKQQLADISASQGVQAAYNALLRTEACLGLRKPTLSIYDHTWHMIGGGQKYGFTMAHALQDMFDVTLLASKEITIANVSDWYHLDLSRCKVKIIPLPFFDCWETPHLDPARITQRTGNPFDAVARESGNYDFFINNSMNEKVCPMSNVSVMVCHFPERRPKDHFYADHYTYVVYNSKYTAGWIEKKWKFKPHKHIYPPVDMTATMVVDPIEKNAIPPVKENIILSVARFEEGGSKKQLEMVHTFLKLNRRFPELLKDWRLVLAGGSGNPDANPYLMEIKQVIHNNRINSIRLMVNCSGDALKEMYKNARVFWHICGLDQTDPALVEHFGMTIVEAMQNRMVPIVFDGGGQREIVEQGVSGFRITTTAQLMASTLKLIRDAALFETMSADSLQRSKLYSREMFEKNVKEFFDTELQRYCTI